MRLRYSLLLALPVAVGCGDDSDPATPDTPMIDAADPTPDTPNPVTPVTLADNEGGEIRLEWIQNNAGQTTSRATAYFYKSQTPAKYPLPAFPGCFDMRARDKWPLAQGTQEALDVGTVIIASPSGQDIVMTKDVTGTSRDPFGRAHPIWYKKAANFAGNDGDAFLPNNEKYDILLTGSTEWPAQVIKGVPFMPAAWTPTSPTSAATPTVPAGQDFVITYTPVTSSNLPPGYKVNTVVAFTATGFGFTDGAGTCTTGCGPVLLCQEEGNDGSITVPAALVDSVLRQYTGGTWVRQNITHALFELTDTVPKPVAERKRVDVLTIYCYNANWLRDPPP